MRSRLLELLVRHSGMSDADVDPDASIWDCFPESAQTRKGRQAVESFCAGVEREFGVFLTEQEWEETTLNNLVDRVSTKVANPQRSIADRRKERAAIRSGTLQGLLFYNALLVLAFFVVDENEKWASGRYLWYLALLVVVNVGIVWWARSESNRMRRL